MTFTCESEKLGKALRDIAPVVSRNPAVAILSNVLIEAESDTVRLTASDLEMSATRTLAATVSAPAAMTVDANRFASVVSSLASGSQAKVTLGTQIDLAAGRSRFKFGALPANQFPPSPFHTDTGAEFEAGNDVLDAISLVRHACSTETVARAFISGVRLENANGVFHVIGTDGKRMAIVKVADTTMTDFGATLPLPLADMLTKMGASLDGAVGIRVNDRAAQFDFGEAVLSGKVIEATFPEWGKFVPTSFLMSVQIDGKAVSDALKRIGILIEDKGRRVELRFHNETLTITNTGRDEGVEEVPCDYSGEPFGIAFDSRYLREALVALDADQVTFDMNVANGPVKITSPQREGVTMVVMPQTS